MQSPSTKKVFNLIDYRPFSEGISKDQQRWFVSILTLCGLVMIWGILKGMIFITGLPVLIFLILLLLFRLDITVFIAVFITPLSINLHETDLAIGASLPSEPLMFIIFILYWLKVIADGRLDTRIFLHPVSLMIILHLFWFFITTIGSSMPMVSIKSTLARYCYVTVFYFMLLQIFSELKRTKSFLTIHLIPLLFVIGYTWYNHYLGGFDEKSAHTAMVPFYNDHTAYAAVISFFIPVMLAFTADRERGRFKKQLSGFITAILILAILLSYTRAAWVGLASAFCCYLIFFLRMKSAIVYSGIFMILVLAFLFRTQITLQLESNNKVSSSDFSSHVQSIGNISNDDSNLERINRWACAIRMFLREPVTGYGPGTYMFKYGSFQKYSQRSGISTNFGEGGGSHSEYLGPLSEQGLPGPLLMIAIIAVTTQTTARYIRRTTNKSNRILAIGVLLGLVTYWIHGVLNYFLDTEKASVPYWGFIAILVALQIYDKEATTSGRSTES